MNRRNLHRGLNDFQGSVDDEGNLYDERHSRIGKIRGNDIYDLGGTRQGSIDENGMLWDRNHACVGREQGRHFISPSCRGAGMTRGDDSFDGRGCEYGALMLLKKRNEERYSGKMPDRNYEFGNGDDEYDGEDDEEDYDEDEEEEHWAEGVDDDYYSDNRNEHKFYVIIINHVRWRYKGRGGTLAHRSGWCGNARCNGVSAVALVFLARRLQQDRLGGDRGEARSDPAQSRCLDVRTLGTVAQWTASRRRDGCPHCRAALWRNLQLAATLYPRRLRDYCRLCGQCLPHAQDAGGILKRRDCPLRRGEQN